MSILPMPDLRDPAAVVDLFDRTAQANLNSPLRHGALIRLPPRGRLLMSGDLHDHSLNLQRLVKLAALDADPANHLVLQEIIHGPHRVNGHDLSIRTLARVAALKLQFPAQVHLLQSNHELAQVRGEDILKGGGSVLRAFDSGVDFIFRDGAEAVREALARYVWSLSLAAMCPRGILCSHSLPAPGRLSQFDPTVLHRLPTGPDMGPGGSAYLMIWGRSHDQRVAEVLGRAWSVKVFVMGHQPVSEGYEVEGDNMLVLGCDHDHGMALPIDLDREYDVPQLVELLVPLASVA
jgi:hypothetical protein